MPKTNVKDFEPKSLAPDIWDGEILRPAVREQMLKAADAFIEEFDIEMGAVKDITLTGSLAGFYWLPTSDVDLHLIVAFDEIDDDDEILRDYYDLAKVVWGKNREQFICGHEVEVYVQDVKQPHHAAGVYSLIEQKWLEKPRTFGDVEVDVDYIDMKVKQLAQKVDYAARLVKSDPSQAMQYIKVLKEKLRNMRRAALAEMGEMSPDNLAFKTMRRYGYIDKLRELYQLAYTEHMSLDC